MYRRILFVLSLIVITASCDKEGGKGSKHTDGPAYDAIMLEDGVPEDEKLSLYWTGGDQISVFRYSDWNEQYQLRGDDGLLEGHFEKVGSTDAAFAGKASKFSTAYAIYPWSTKTTCVSEGVFKVSYPEKQPFTSPRMAEGLSTFVATTASGNETELEFHNVTGYLRIPVYGVASVKTVELKGNDGEKIAGFANIDIKADGQPDVKMCEDASETIKLNVGGLEIKKNEENPSLFYITLPPTEFKKGLTITFTEPDGLTFEKVIEGSLEVSAGKVTSLDTFEYQAVIAEIEGTQIHSGYTIAGLVTDKAGNKLAGIPVSDGYDIVVTDENGVYQIKANELSRYVYYVVPAEYEIPLDNNKCPMFYSLKVKAGEFSRNDFVLTPKTKDETNWTLVGISDPQVVSDSHVNRYKTETLPDIKKMLADEGKENCYAIVLGDIVGGVPNLYPKMKNLMSNFALGDGSVMPFFMLPGNHDHYKSGAKSQYESLEGYISNFGPSEYSFNIGKAHIVVMDTHQAINWSGNAGGSYTCGFDDNQLAWLQKDLALVENKGEKMLIFCTHAAFGDQGSHGNYVATLNHKTDVLNLMTDFYDVNLISGHTHYWRNFTLKGNICKSGRPIYEHNEGAACGWLWLTGNINTDGSPNGYAVFDVRGNMFYDWIAKSTNQPKEYQMRAYNGNQIYYDKDNQKYCWYDKNQCDKSTGRGYVRPEFKNSLVVSIWGDDRENWTAELYVGGVKQGDLKRITGLATDMCAQAYFPQTGQGSSLFEQAKYADHMWYIEIPGGDPSALTDWEVRATQTIPTSGVKHVYTCDTLQTDFAGF
ncbi:MAG: calcineurin-like phosphoesterase C-terminal domain-containing protein [Bacteroidales bacterium]|nr:calcineurin-like phosphoesterase C-terminal domain-containing protein [Bacteroidales bacterium]